MYSCTAESMVFRRLVRTFLCAFATPIFAQLQTPVEDVFTLVPPASLDAPASLDFQGLGSLPLLEVDTIITAGFRGLPLMFEENLGQHHPDVKFYQRGRGYHAIFTRDEMVLVFSRQRGPSATHPFDDAGKASALRPLIIRMGYSGDARMFRPTERRGFWPGQLFYRQRSDALAHKHLQPSRIRYKEIYPGIDAVFYSNSDGLLQYDFVAAPGADPSAISLRCEGASSVEVEPAGTLLLTAGEQQIRWSGPQIFQQIEGLERPVSGNYQARRLAGSGSRPVYAITFHVAQFHGGHALVIYPALLYSTFFGGG